MSKLASMFDHMLRRARTSGALQVARLRGGAEIYVKIAAGRVTVTLARNGAKLGDREIVTFRRDFCIPDQALRRPEIGQDRKEARYFVRFSWADQAEQPAAEEEPHG